MNITQKTRNMAFGIFFVALVLGLGSLVSKANADEEYGRPPKLPINMEKALKIAREAGGSGISEIELENEDGQWVYEAELKLPGGGEREILIDAQTGKVLKDEVED